MPLYSQAVNITMTGVAGGAMNDTIRIYSNIFVLSGTFNSTTGYSLDISLAGFTTITNVSINPISNTGTLTNIPIVSEKSRSNTGIVVNIMTVSSNLISILGTTVTGLVFASSLTGISIDLRVEGT